MVTIMRDGSSALLTRNMGITSHSVPLHAAIQSFSRSITRLPDAELRHLLRQTTGSRHPEHGNIGDSPGNRSALIISVMWIVWCLGLLVGLCLLLSMVGARGSDLDLCNEEIQTPK
jgi:hypothetical protein